ncbi:N-acetylglucosamine kinase 1 [Ophidiomyces ophidiicola]|nr:N-acetylglucosamine kinase 1 [Ophidiomyces ophidiicola]
MGDYLVKAARQLQEFFSSLIQILQKLLRGEASQKHPSFINRWRRRSLDGFAEEIEHLFTSHLSPKNLASISKKISSQLRTSAKSSQINMLPSFNHSLPTGQEKGSYLALDVGGSTFRVALVQLSGKDGKMTIRKMTSSHINEKVKALQGKAFFDWMAEKIEVMLKSSPTEFELDFPLSMGLSWSFPIDQTSIRSGKVIAMGKGFRCSDGTVGDDLRDLIMEACQKRNLDVSLEAIVNDSSATLLSRAYSDLTTRMSLILGTGTNMAVHFPVHALGIEKYGVRSPEWFAHADHVITNTEISMFGGGLLQMTRWDDDLNRNHIKPDYQPLEYMCTGRYLGEIVRLIAAEATQTAGLFGGKLPASLQSRYSLDTAVLACIEEDTSPSFTDSIACIQKHHEFAAPPTPSDIAFLHKVCHAVSQRAAAYLAVAIHGLWCLRNESETPILPATPESASDDMLKVQTAQPPNDPVRLQVNIACDGSVISKYPNFRSRCQDYLNQLTLEPEAAAVAASFDSATTAVSKTAVTSSVQQLPSITLDLAPEGGIFGAAVAVAVAAPSNR